MDSKKLESAGELVRIKEYINPVLEISEITDRVSNMTGRLLLFENTGTDFPLLINAMGNRKRMAMALGVKHLDAIAEDMEEMFKQLTSPKESILDKLKMPPLSSIAGWMPKVISGKGACQEVVMKNPDITKFPCSEMLAGRWWSIHHFAGYSYQRPNTGIPMSDCTECRSSLLL